MYSKIEVFFLNRVNKVVVFVIFLPDDETAINKTHMVTYYRLNNNICSKV